MINMEKNVWPRYCRFRPPQTTLEVIFQIRVGVLDVVSKSKCHKQWGGVGEPLFVALWDLEAKSKTPTRICNGLSHINTSLDIHSIEAVTIAN